VKKRIAILGSTGSIGQSALAVVDEHCDRLTVVGLAAGENADRFAEQIARYRPTVAAMASGSAIDRLNKNGASPTTRIVGTGRDGLAAVATHPDVDIVLCASSGTEGLEAVLAAIEHGKTVALANKEVLVMAGAIVTAAARARGVAILPVDSEHNAIHQCLHGRRVSDIRRLILTASGGPFRGRALSDLGTVTAAAALKHPTWKMGRKITIDSATLMNKGLEVIEAHWLFGASAAQIDVVVHPESIVHSLVEYPDGSVLAQLGNPDMRTALAQALAWPERVESGVAPLDLLELRRLNFEAPDRATFRCLDLAYQALAVGGTAPTILNAANEVAVGAFLGGTLPFLAIDELIEATLAALPATSLPDLESLIYADLTARREAQRIIQRSFC